MIAAELHAVRRTAADTGRMRAKRARRAGLTPGIVYGPGVDGSNEYLPLWVRAEDLVHEHNARPRSWENTIVELHVDNRVELVIPRHMDVDPITRRANNITFLRYVPQRKPGARITLPFRTINEDRCDAFKQGGWMLELQPRLPVYAFGDAIPDFLILDLRGKQIGDKIMASEVHLNEGIALRSKQGDFPVAKFAGSKRLMMQRQAALDAAATGKAAGKKAKGAAAAAVKGGAAAAAVKGGAAKA